MALHRRIVWHSLRPVRHWFSGRVVVCKADLVMYKMALPARRLPANRRVHSSMRQCAIGPACSCILLIDSGPSWDGPSPRQSAIRWQGWSIFLYEYYILLLYSPNTWVNRSTRRYSDSQEFPQHSKSVIFKTIKYGPASAKEATSQL